MKNIRFFLLCLPLFSYAQSGVKNFIDQPYIEVTGKAEMEIVPDEIYLKILLNEKDNKGRTPVEALERAMITKLQELGIDVSKDLAVQDLASNFKSYWLQKSDILLSKEYQLLVRSAQTAGKVFVELEKIGISNISIEQLNHSQIEQFRQEVKINAIKAAKDKAQALATAIDQSVGKALYVQELDNQFYPVNAVSNIAIRGSRAYGNATQGEPNIDFEKIKLEYSILVRFELK